MKTVYINGSPKKKGSVSVHLLNVVRCFAGGKAVPETLRHKGDHQRILESLRDADAVVFGFPLYVDGVPSHVLSFLKEMEVFCREKGIAPRVYVLSNGGFIEGCQNKALMQVMENFCRRSGLEWCGGIGIGGGVMLNVLRILFFVYIALLGVSVLGSGLQTGNWLPADAFLNFAQQMFMILFFNLGVLFYGIRMGAAIRKGRGCGVKFTRALMPSFLFILMADIFFVLISVFQGGLFRGWLRRK